MGTDAVDLGNLSGMSRQAASDRPPISRVRVVRPPASEGDSLTVALDGYSLAWPFDVPVGHWTPHGTALPQEGDVGLAIIDPVTGDAWLTGYDRTWTDPIDPDAVYPTPTGGDDRPELESLLAAGQTDIQMRSGTYSIQASIFGIAGKSNVKIRGAGVNRTIVRPTPTTGNIFDLTGSSFCEISDMSIVPTAQRTAGAMILLDAGGGSCQQNNLRRLLLSSSFIGIELVNCSTTLIEDIQIGDLNAAWGWQSAIFLNGAAISTTVNRLRGGTAAGMSSGIVRLNASAIDTFHGNDWDVLAQSPATGMVGLYVAGGTWTTLNQCSIESGDQQSLTVIGGTGTHLNNCHWLGQILISGGNDLQIRGGTNVGGTSNLPVRMTAGVGTSIDGLTVHDSITGAVCIRADNGVNDFKVVNCDLGRAYLGIGGVVATLVQVGTSSNAQDRYIVDLNRGRNFSGAALIDNGTGTNKRVGAVPTSNVFVA